VANPFDEMYSGTPPWDIGRPQAPFVILEDQGKIGEVVLDVGCGTGDLATFLAQRGHDVTGVDASGKAIEKARKKAKDAPGAQARFVVGDALKLEKLGKVFDTVLDCGLFHTFGDGAREAYTGSLERVLRPGGAVYILCFSDEEPEWGGPRRVKKQDLEAAFKGGWWIDSITPARMESTVSEEGAKAWLFAATYEGRPAGGLN
jgi:ubiquinone/menaquinone biosynthesis C-methylase UbiE